MSWNADGESFQREILAACGVGEGGIFGLLDLKGKYLSIHPRHDNTDRRLQNRALTPCTTLTSQTLHQQYHNHSLSHHHHHHLLIQSSKSGKDRIRYVPPFTSCTFTLFLFLPRVPSLLIVTTSALSYLPRINSPNVVAIASNRHACKLLSAK